MCSCYNFPMGKTGFVVEGGGMKCAYSAGILDKFLDDDITFDYGIGVSAGSANGCSFLAGQRGRNLRFYTEHVKRPRYFGPVSFLTSGDFFGIKYIFGKLTESDGIDPLDQEALLLNPAEFVVVATDAETGEPAYFHKEDIPIDDYRIIMASCAIPVVCHPIKVGEKKYFDGGISDAIPVQRALDDGCEKLVVILSKNRDFVKNPEKHRKIYSAALRRYPKVIELLDHRHEMYRERQERVLELEKEGKAFVFAPSRHLSMGTYTMDGNVNQRLYDLALRDYEKRKEELKAFLAE